MPPASEVSASASAVVSAVDELLELPPPPQPAITKAPTRVTSRHRRTEPRSPFLPTRRNLLRRHGDAIFIFAPNTSYRTPATILVGHVGFKRPLGRGISSLRQTST